MSIPQPPPFARVIGHRGAAGHAPENTLASIREAARLGAAWVEFDVMLSGDGVPVLIHDETVNRTTDGQGRVSDKPLAALQALDAGRWFARRFAGQRIPALAETVETLAALGLAANVEIKPAAGHEAETGLVVGRFLATRWPAGLPTPIVSSFSKAALETLAAEAPRLPRALLVGRVPDDWQTEVRRLGCASLHCSQRHLTRRQAEAVLASGTHLLCYTVNRRSTARKLFGWGVEALFSDYPDRLLDM